jgi:rod shape-determining protein MreC
MFRVKKIKRLSVILLAVLVLLIFLHYLKILQPVENLVVGIFSPAQHQVYVAGSEINNFYTNLSSKKDLVGANRKLDEEVKRLIVENAQLKTEIQECKEITQQTDFLQSQGFVAVIAKVIGRNPQPGRQAIILNKGQKDGIQKDMPVITSNGIIVGQIIESFGSSSQAILVNDSQSRIAAIIENEYQSKGIVSGEHGIGLKMDLIPQNELIKEDEIVVTSGLEQSIPRGLVVGKITRVANEPNSFFQSASIQSLVKIDNLTIVSVLISPSYDKDFN